MTTESLTLSGVVKNVTFRNEENGYFVARLSVGDKEVMVIGTTPIINVGERMDATGTWERSKWGVQFKASNVDLQRPVQLEGIEKYLSSGAIQGIGPTMAKRLVKAFGDKVFEVIENEGHRLAEVEGIGKKRVKAILETYQAEAATREIMVVLFQAGLTANKAQRVFEVYGADAKQKILNNPYLLCRDVWGMGFAQADAVAQKQEVPLDSPFRLRAALSYVMDQAAGEGSCGLPVEMALTRAAKLVGFPEAMLEGPLEMELEAKLLVRDTVDGQDCLFLPRIYFAEKAIASKLVRLSRLAPRKKIDNPEQHILFAELDLGITLEETQREAVLTALKSNVCVITGGPGTGKTTITKTVLEALTGQGLTVALAAPTGKAARRAAEVSGREAVTIHRLLEVRGKGGFNRNEDNPLEADVIVLDEASMMDVNLLHQVLKAIPFTSRLIIVGDVDQLPSVGPGKVLADIIDSGVVPTVKLTKVFRQAATSHIVRNAHLVNRGELPEYGWDESSDFRFFNPGFPPNPLRPAEKTPENEEMQRQMKEKGLVRVLRFVTELWKKGYDPIRDVQILAPTRNSPLGTLALNMRLKEALNGLETARLERPNGYSFSPGDKVMQLRNNYEKGIFNGDVGYIHDVDLENRSVMVDYDGRFVAYTAKELDEITLAYAMTVHKSQGSEFPVVVLLLDSSHFTMLKKNLVYTAITRAKKLMVVMGTVWAAGWAVRNSQIEERYSKLRDWLRLEDDQLSRVAGPRAVEMAH